MDDLYIKHIRYIFNELGKCIQRYHKFDDTTRFLMLIDKFYLITTSSTLGIIASLSDRTPAQIANGRDDEDVNEETEKRNMIIDEVTKISNLLKSELSDLEDFIREKKETSLKSIENKLDEVLLGPDYHTGALLMNEAKEDFDSRI